MESRRYYWLDNISNRLSVIDIAKSIILKVCSYDIDISLILILCFEYSIFLLFYLIYLVFVCEQDGTQTPDRARLGVSRLHDGVLDVQPR
jgi:hypothetical protein